MRGAGAPPVKTEKGWLLFYHAMNQSEYGEYKVGAMLLDYKDPVILFAALQIRYWNPLQFMKKAVLNQGWFTSLEQ